MHADCSILTIVTMYTLTINKAAKGFLRGKFWQWYAKEVEKQFQAGVVESGVKVNMGMPVMAVGAQWLTALYDKLCTKTSIVINGLKNTGIVEDFKMQENTLTLMKKRPTVIAVYLQN